MSTGWASRVDRVTTDTAEQAEVRALVRSLVHDLARPERVREHDEAERFDEDLYRALGEAGLLRLDADPSARRGPDPAHQIVVLEELAAGPTSMAVCLVVQYMAVRLLCAHGDEGQQRTVLEPLLDGTGRLAFALSEADGGTDVARALRTRAELRDDGWHLDGAKTWISGAAGAEHALVLARTGPGHPSAIDGITTFVVPLERPGVSVRVLDTFAIHGLDTCEVVLDDVRLGPEAVLGEREQGFRQVLATLNGERLNAAAAALGIARGALTEACTYAGTRTAFGRPIGAFQALQHALVDSAIRVEAARGLITRAAAADDRTDEAETLSAMAKVAASEAATTATDVGMRVLAGNGLSREYPMQRFFRDARLYTFAPFTDEMMRNFLGERWLGLPRSY